MTRRTKRHLREAAFAVLRIAGYVVGLAGTWRGLIIGLLLFGVAWTVVGRR
jgi:hypothetical protein